MQLIWFIFFLVTTIHGVNGNSCPAITNTLQTRKLRRNNPLSIIENNTINLAATPFNIKRRKWPMGKTPDHKFEIPYALERGLDSEIKEAVYYSMVIIERGTNIIFVKKRRSDENYIYIQSTPGSDDCHSFVGYEKDGPQLLELAKRCANPEDATHELLHAVGLDHEHQRPDRPIPTGTPWDDANQYAIDPVETGITQYDPFSIMHYKLSPNVTFSSQGGWTELDTKLARLRRVFPSPCDFYGVNKLYEGLRQGPPCKNVRAHPMNLHPTDNADQSLIGIFGNYTELSATDMCNWGSGEYINYKLGEVVFSHNRMDRKLCQLENNRLYPDFSWIPNAAMETIPLEGVDYTGYDISLNRNQQEYPPQHMCDCLPAPPATAGFTDNSMFQTCLECVHFENTTDAVLHCISNRSVGEEHIYAYLKESYPSSYYVGNHS